MKDKLMAQEKRTYNALLVSKDKETSEFLTRMLKIINVETLYAKDKKTASQMIASSKVLDLLIIDYVLPDGTGIELLESLNEKQIIYPTIMIYDSEETSKLPSLVAGANIILTKPFSDAELLMVVRNLLKISEIYDRLAYAEQVIEALVAAVEARDYYTFGHSKRVSEYSVKMFDALGFNDKKDREDLRVGCLLHDIGKIGVPDSILKSTGKLTSEEFEEIKKHPLIGYNICKSLDKLEGSLPVIVQHHERLDGSGYPYGLKGGEISALAQITMIPDVYDALTTKRSYRNAMSCAQALKIMEAEAAEGKLNDVYLEVFKSSVLTKATTDEVYGCKDD